MKPLFEIDESYHGKGPVVVCWQNDGNYLATSGVNGLVQIFDRHGQQVDEVALSSNQPCLDMHWCKDNKNLAILLAGSGIVPIYDMSTKQLTELETNLKDPTFIKWSKVGPQLAIGTAKGNLLLYRKDNRKKVPLLGKHSGKITCGCWSDDNRLALGSSDKKITISNCDGDTLETIPVKNDPLSISFSPDSGKQNSSDEEEKSGGLSERITVNLGGKTILICDLKDIDNAKQLGFEARYGKIVKFSWVDENSLLIGFSNGFVVAVSVRNTDFGEELFSIRAHKNSLQDLAVNNTMQRAASSGDGYVKILDTKRWKESKDDAVSINSGNGKIEQLAWTKDGQILTVGTSKGHVYNYLAQMPNIHDACDCFVAYLSSLRELSIVNVLEHNSVGSRAATTSIPIKVEPLFVALAQQHVAVGINTKVYYYHYNPNTCEHQLVNEHEYMGSVSRLRLNSSFAAALCSNKIYLHRIEPDPAQGDSDSKVFPQADDGNDITCMALTTDLLIYGTRDGTLSLYSLADDSVLSGADFRHTVGIKEIFPNPIGTRILLIDEAGNGFLYNPIDARLLEIPDFNPRTSHIMWDGQDWNVFITSDKQSELATYLYSPLTLNGPIVTKIGPVEIQESGDMDMMPLSTQLPTDYSPICSFNGVVTCQLQNAQLGTVILGSHEGLSNVDHSDLDSLSKSFTQALALARLGQAWELALTLDSRPFYLALSGKAMELMEISAATRVWRQLGDAGMVLALEKIKYVEDKHLLAGHIASLFGDYSTAQELFLMSPSPEQALMMRRDLLHWDQALKLAETVAPEEVPEISIEYAQQLEFKGEYNTALKMYESASSAMEKEDLSLLDEDSMLVKKQKRHKTMAGVARMTLRVGNIPRGVQLASDSKDKQLCKECADILVSLKQFPDAALLYEKAQQYESAASIYIKAKNFKAAAPLMAKIKAPKLHLQFAKAKESEKDYKTAAKEYELAKDTDSVIRLYLDHLNSPEKAFTIVRKTHSAVGAEMVARYCQSVSDFRGAIEFLLMAKRGEEAFELATSHDTMEVYEKVLGGDGTPDKYVAIAKYYETKQAWAKAAEFYSICGQYHKALKLYLQCGDAEMDKAIHVVGKARNDMLTHTLIDFLMGETDGIQKEPQYVFRLYMALGNYPQAAKTAIIIAKQEQENGNYKGARQTLFETHTELEAKGMKVPQALRQALLLLHSYILVKKLVKMNDHDGAARMLIRVAKNVSKFPKTVVPILTSTVVECYRAKLKKSAHEYASMLMRPEYRQSIDPKFKRRVEQIVRKKGKDPLEDEEEALSPSPYTGEPMPQSELICPTTKNHIPYCIITGRHMVLGDWCVCPNSKMPALYSEYIKYLTAMPAEEQVDPMLGLPVAVHQLEKVKDAKPLLDAFASSFNEQDDEEEDDNEY